MEFIGAYLKRIRIKKKIKLELVSKELNISKDILRNIENDNFPIYLSTVFLIGHIKSYANFLDLNQNDIIESFKIQISYNKPLNKEKIPKPVSSFSLKFTSYKNALTFSSFVIIVISFYFLFIKPSSIEREYAMTPDLPENLFYGLESIDQSINQIDKNNLNDNDKIVFEENDKFVSSSVNASLPKKKDSENLKSLITLKFINQTWVQLRDSNDKIILSKLMDRGEEYSFNLLDNLNLTAGNAGNIIISINGIVKGKIGKSGEVIESFIFDDNFIN